MIVSERARLAAVLTVSLLALAECGGSSHSKSAKPSIPTPQPAATSTASVPTSTTAPSSAGVNGTVSGSSGGLSATMQVSTHRPKVDRPWPVHFIVTRGGHGVKASVSYEFLFGGQVVAHRSHYAFDGRFSDILTWPSSAVGYPLTFRAVIVSGAATINLDYQVQVTT
jgi:hypothetical protein